MLKKIRLGDQELPVPIPLKTLQEVIDWVLRTFNEESAVLTSIKLDGDEYLEVNSKERRKVLLDGDSDLQIRLETPYELASQAIDTVQNLASTLRLNLAKLSIHCWEEEKFKANQPLNELQHDLLLILDLIDHANSMTDYSHEDMAPINANAYLLKAIIVKLKEAAKNGDLKKCAYILLNRVDGILKEIEEVGSELQLKLAGADLSKFFSPDYEVSYFR